MTRTSQHRSTCAANGIVPAAPEHRTIGGEGANEVVRRAAAEGGGAVEENVVAIGANGRTTIARWPWGVRPHELSGGNVEGQQVAAIVHTDVCDVAASVDGGRRIDSNCES